MISQLQGALSLHYGFKFAAPNPEFKQEFKQVYKTPKKEHYFNRWVQGEESGLSLDEAKELTQGMAKHVPHGALDTVRFDLNGVRGTDLSNRYQNNPRMGQFGKELDAVLGNHDEVEQMIGSRNQALGDFYMPSAHVVSNPSGVAGIAAHELGHAIDFNSIPEDSGFLRRAGNEAYKRYAPTVWHEHAAWRKGRNATMDGYASGDINPELARKVLATEKGTKPVGLGSYWGAAVGGGLGLAGLVGLVAAIKNGDIHPRAARLGLLLPLLGAAGGAVTGTLGAKMMTRNAPKEEKIKNFMAKSLLQRGKASTLDEAKQIVDQQLAERRKAGKKRS